MRDGKKEKLKVPDGQFYKSLIKKDDYKKLFNEGRRNLNKLICKTEENPLKRLIDEGKLV